MHPPLTVHLPRWSPDGRSIVFAGAAVGERQGHLLVMMRDPTTKYFDSFAVFRPDRQALEPLGKLPLGLPQAGRRTVAPSAA